MSKETKILSVVVVVIVAAMVGLFLLAGGSGKSTSEQKVDQSKLIRDNSHKKGAGKVTVVEFGDYQCPACGQAHPTTQRLIQEYGDKITFVFRNFPLPIHKNAEIAAQSAEAAGAQGKFWEMHDKLYVTQTSWENSTTARDTFITYAQDLGLDVAKFTKDIDSKAFQSVIDQDKNDGNALNITGTPTFYVNGTQATGFDYATLSGAINDALGSN